MTPGGGDALSHQAGEGGRLLAVEIALQAVADGLVEQDARPPRPQHHRHLAGRRRNGLEIDQRLAQGLVGGRAPGPRLQVALVGDPRADPVTAGLQALALADDDRDVEPHQGPDIGDADPVGAQHLHRLPLAGERDRHLAHPFVLGPDVGVHVGEQLHLALEIHQVEGVVVDIEALVGAAGGRGEGAPVPGLYGLHRVAGAPDGVLAELGSVRVAGGFAGDGAQPEALGGIEAGALQPAVVEDQAFGLAVFQEQLPVVGAVQGLRDDGLDAPLVKAGAGEEQLVGGGKVAHGGVLLQRATPAGISGRRGLAKTSWPVMPPNIGPRGRNSGEIDDDGSAPGPPFSLDLGRAARYFTCHVVIWPTGLRPRKTTR